MRLKLVQILTVSALVGAVGGHWAILQSVAWLGMVVNYSQNLPLQEALVKTFDGKHPCKLCKAVQAGKNAEKKPDTQKVETKLDFLLATRQVVVLPIQPVPFPMASAGLMAARTEPPPIPPPRSLRG